MALIPDTPYTVVKTGFNKVFHYAPLNAMIKQAVDFVTPLRIQGQLLATFHVIRLVENSIPVPRLTETFWNQCYQAVSTSTGPAAEQFDPARNPLLAASLTAYSQHLPVGHQEPERPTFIKDIVTQTAQLAEVNFRNHVVTNFRPRIKCWIRLRIGTYAYFGNMHRRKLKSWASLLLWAGTTPNQSVTALLPSNQAAFVKITTSGLHRLLHCMPNRHRFLPNLNSRITHDLVEVKKVFWWMMFTGCPQFCKKLSIRKKGWHFDREVLTDGVSVSIVLAQFPSPAPYAILPTMTPHQLPKKPPPPAPSVTGPVGATHPVVQTAGRIVGLDPGRNSLFVAVVHSQRAHTMIGAPQPTPADKYATFGWSRSKWYDSSDIDRRNARMQGMPLPTALDRGRGDGPISYHVRLCNNTTGQPRPPEFCR
ncbi:hypothetical protein WJX79_005103 [Trebouxia sp. C0005]